LINTRPEVGARYAVPTPRRPVPLGTVCAASVLLWAAAAASATGGTATPNANSQFACHVAPRSREDIAALLADLDIATPTATTAGQTLPEGIPVSADTADAIEQIVRTWLACQNAGEPLRAWTLFTDGYLYRLLSREAMPDLIASPVATPGAGANGGAMLIDIRGERSLPDGRHGAIVSITYPSVPMPKTFFFYFTETDGRLLIDGILGEISFSVP
jgi:hypothetical protein